MTDLKTQLRTYYEATTEPVGFDPSFFEVDTVVVGPIPDAARRRNAMTSTEAPKTRGAWQRPLTAVASLATIVVLVGAALWLVNDNEPDNGATDQDTAAVVVAFQNAYNAADLERIVSMFADDAVITGFPGPLPVIRGTAQIQSSMAADLLHEGKYRLSELEVSGQTATFRHNWSSDRKCGTAAGHLVVVSSGLIQEWTWPTVIDSC